MSDPLIREINNFVVLEPGENERFLTSEETLKWLENWLTKIDELPSDLQKLGSIHAAAQHLIETACDLEVKPGFNLQWFAVRLDPPGF